MKEGWEYKTLGDVATFTRGLTYSKHDETEHSSKIVLRSNNILLDNGKLIFDELKFLREDFEIPQDKLVKRGALLMCMSNGSKAHLGKVALIDDDYQYAFGGFMGLVTHNETVTDRYFWYTLTTPIYRAFIEKLSAGANINNIKVRDLEKFRIPVPPLSEQQSIVDYLDAAFAKIEAMKGNAEKALNEAKALFQASLKEMLEPKEGWEEKTVGDIAEIKGGKRIPKGEKLLSESTSHKYIRVADFNEKGSVDLNNIQYISDEVYSQIKRYIINKEDIYISIAGTIGKSGIIPDDLDGANLTENACRLILSNVINQKFMYYVTISPEFIHQEKVSTKISAQPKLALTRLAEINVSFPSLAEQQTIVTALDAIKAKVDRLQANYDKIAKECDALKQAILKEVFE